MKKLILPILFGVLTLFFSGKPDSHKNCGPFLTIDRWWVYDPDGPPFTPVTQVNIYNWTTGTWAVYHNPTFPFNHNAQGGRIEVSYLFDGNTYSGCLWVHLPPSCVNVTNYIGAYVASVTFDAFDCNQYDILLEAWRHGNCYCP